MSSESSDRCLAHLVQLAQQHAPQLLMQATPAAGRALLANGLARSFLPYLASSVMVTDRAWPS